MFALTRPNQSTFSDRPVRSSVVVAGAAPVILEELGCAGLAVEVISPGNSAAGMLQKVHQSIPAGCPTVGVVYPSLALVAIHDSSGSPEVNNILEEGALSGGIEFSLPWLDIFDKDLAK